MNTVGVFAGRGDVIIAIFLALLVGSWLGYKLKSLVLKLKGKIKNE